MPLPEFLRSAALTGTFALLASAAGAETVTVFAAASLKTALDEIASDWEAQTGNTVTISSGASSAMAKQIEQGAPADLFISAAVNWMDTLQEGGLIRADTRKDLLGNTLVLIASGNDMAPVDIKPGFDLAGLLGGDKLAMAIVDSVPAGQYGKEALTSLGVWDTIEGSVAQVENVRAALALVTTGEAPFGIVYASDAVADDVSGDQVTVVGTFPADSHAPIIYPAALVATTTTPAAQEFLNTLSSDQAKATFERLGFVVLK